jgi:sugar lactone lactonase YvrE
VRTARSWIIFGVLVVYATGAVGAIAGQQRAAVGPTFKVVGKWGGPGAGNGQIPGNAFGLATDKAGNVYVADSDGHRIQIFTSKGAFKSKLAFAASEFVEDVAVATNGDVWGTALQAAQARRFPGGAGQPESVNTPKSADGIAVDADGNVYVSTNGDSTHVVVRFDKTPTGWTGAKTWVGGLQAPGDVEVSSDGSVYVVETRGSPPNIKRYDASGKLLKTIKLRLAATAGAGVWTGIGIDPDCNIWSTNVPNRDLEKYSPAGKLLATTTSGDLQAQDVAVGPTGDLYAYDGATHKVIHFAENRAKPATAAVPGTISVVNGKAKVRFALPGVACPAQVAATATLAGKGIAGRLTTTVGAGKFTNLEIPVRGPAGKTVSATFKIVLKTNGRPTTQVRKVMVSFSK